ncbi:MAG: hypothetical protein AAF587_43665 [Bacteroidota bacterium]
METENTTFLQIEAYLGKEMNEEERLIFEQEMESNSDLAHEVALQRKTHALLSLNNQLAYKAKLQAFDAELEAAQTTVIRPFWTQTWVKAVAGVAFLLVLGYSLAYLQYNSQSIRQGAFSPYNNAFSVRHTDSELEKILKDGIEAYSEQRYQTAIELLSQIPYDPAQPLPRLYLGISYLAIGDGEAALRELHPISQTNSAVSQAAEWYGLLAQLEEGPTDAALAHLKEVASTPDHSYQKKAQGLHRQLDHPLRRWLRIP